MPRLCLTLARFCSAMWIGAALLFVATSIAEQTHHSFDGLTKDALALIRFPWFYGTGFTLLAGSLLATRFAGLPARPRNSAMLLLLAAVLLMAADHTFIYRPMRELLSSAAGGRGPAFERLHFWTEGLNAAGLLLAAAASVVLCAARAEPPPRRV